MATIVPEEMSGKVPIYQFKEDIPKNAKAKDVKLHKCTVFAWAVLIPILIIALITSIILYATAQAKLHSIDSTSPHDDLSVCKRKFDLPPLVIISFDGFRDSYLDENITPTIQRLINYGTHSKYMLPTFPSKTFPNHYTIATGLYPAWHGVVDNRFYDKKFKRFFQKNTTESGWYLGEPIWETARKAGLKSAVFFWPGSEGAGIRPNHWSKYNGSVPLTHRIETLIKWLNLPDGERPSIIKIYFEEPDYSGHLGGPYSHAVRTALVFMDGMLNHLISELTKHGLMGCINFILLSDHGMQQIMKERSVVVEDQIGRHFNDFFYSGVVARIELNQTAHSILNDTDETIDNLLLNLKCQNESNYIAYRKDLVPIRFHYAGPRVGDIIIKGRPGVCIFKTPEEKESFKLFGDHGYDNRLVSMRTIFIAVGPDIARNQEIDEFQNIELYNLFAHLLRIDAAPNNGTEGTLFSVLRNPPPFPKTAVNHPSDQCVDEINLKACTFLHDCPPMNDTYQNCPTTFHSSVSASYQFTGELCNIRLCDAIIHFDKKSRKTVMVEGILKDTNWTENTKENCVTYIDGVEQINSCDSETDEGQSFISLLGNLDRYNKLDLARITVPKSFAEGIWQHVLKKISKFLATYGSLRFISGVAYDQNGDGVRDSEDLIGKSYPSHLFFVFMWCENQAVIDHTLCNDIVFLPYILPFKGKNLSCLKPSEYLNDNIVRMRDIELLTGIEFFTDRNIWTDAKAVQLRTLLPVEELLLCNLDE